MSATVASARRDWEDGYRQLLQESRDSARADRLHHQVDTVTDALRRRVGSTFTLDELAHAYLTSDKWARAAVEEHAATAGWASSLSMAIDAAFHIYSRGALDYVP